MVYAKLGGQTECIMGNWKIENDVKFYFYLVAVMVGITGLTISLLHNFNIRPQFFLFPPPQF